MFPHEKRERLRDSISTKSCSTQEVSTTHNKTHRSSPSLDEEHQLLTEQIVQLKMELATWKGKQDEHNLTRQHLNADVKALREEIAMIEAECITYQNNTAQSREEMATAMNDLHQLRLNVAIEEEEVEPLRIQHETTVAELHAAREEFDQVKKEEESMQKEIDKLENDKTRIASKKSQIDSEVNKLESDIDNMQKEVDAAQQIIHESSSQLQYFQAELEEVKKDNHTICRKNEKIEGRIAALSGR